MQVCAYYPAHTLDAACGAADARMMTTPRPAFAVPPGLERLSHTPLAVAIGMSVTHCDAKMASATMAASDAVSLAGGRGTDPLALLPFLDQLSSFPVAVGAGGNTAMSTIELAVALPPVGRIGDVVAQAHAMTDQGRARLVTGVVRDPSGATVATSTAWFALGAPPGGQVDAPEPPPRAIEAHGPFQRLIGLTPEGEDGARLAADVWPAVGWTGMPALHGGAIAAALARAGQRCLETQGRDDLRLAGITIRYLRAAATTGARALASVDAAGRRTARLSARMEVAGDVVATAQLLFVAA